MNGNQTLGEVPASLIFQQTQPGRFESKPEDYETTEPDQEELIM